MSIPGDDKYKYLSQNPINRNVTIHSKPYKRQQYSTSRTRGFPSQRREKYENMLYLPSYSRNFIVKNI